MLIQSSEMVVPRLELNWNDVPGNECEKICWYRMVLPLRDIDKRLEYHEGVDAETKTLHIPICNTVDRVSNNIEKEWRGPIFPDDTFLLPHSDKMHGVWDAGVLNLPLYVSYKDKAQLLASPGQVIYNDKIVLSKNMGKGYYDV